MPTVRVHNDRLPHGILPHGILLRAMLGQP